MSDVSYIQRNTPRMQPGFEPNQLYRELMSISGLNPLAGTDSSSRGVMYCSHLGQYLVVNGLTLRRMQTGMEREYGKYTFNTKMPTDAQVIKVIDRYRKTLDKNSINFNPQTVVIYEDMANNEIGMVSMENFCSNHPYFGFEYKRRGSATSKLHQTSFVKKGTVLQDSPAVTESGNYMYGVECNMAYMSLPGVSEDGIIISRDVLPRFGFKTFEKRTVSFGHKRFPINLYGDEKNYKPFPDIGDRIGEDGILMALRSYDRDLAVVEQSPDALREPDMIFDKLFYANGAGGKIVDIIIHHELDSSQQGTPEGMDEQPMKYDAARRVFYQEIFNEWQRLKRQRGDNLRLTPEFHRMVVEAWSVVATGDNARVQKLYRREPLDDYRIEFVIQYDITPDIGFKLTDCHGGKGVICKIVEPHEMPVNEFGVRADLIMDPNSTISRMNLGRLYEQKINATSAQVTKNMQQRLGIIPGVKIDAWQLAQMDQTEFSAVWDYLMGYYRIVSPDHMYQKFTTDFPIEHRHKHMASVLSNGIYLFFPPDNSPSLVHMMLELAKSYPVDIGPVTYVGNSGNRVTTVESVLIGSMYIMLLEKTGDDWTAVASGKVQHLGLPSQVTNADKYSKPVRNQAIRAWGEAEVRNLRNYAGERVTAEIQDRNNNPQTHAIVVDSILNAKQPTNIECSVDRRVNPFGFAKPEQIVNHVAECQGWKVVYRDYSKHWENNVKRQEMMARQ